MTLLRSIILCTLCLCSCSKNDDVGKKPKANATQATSVKDIVSDYADLMHKMYSDNVALAGDLRTAIETFKADPTEAHFEACKSAWRAARPHYIQTEVARFSGGPIDRSPDGPEAFINAWPLDESYIDYVIGEPKSGLINQADQTLTIDALRAANEQGGETHVSTGWHAIEFLLWGQDVDPGPGGGERSYTDYVDGKGVNAERRRAYLSACAEMLVRDLTFVQREWAPGKKDNYRANFLALEPNSALKRIVTGVGSLAFAELRGERLTAPYTTKDKEDEHSCFSDTTHLDHLHDAIGIQNVWLGKYESSSGQYDFEGRGLRSLARERDPKLSAAVERKLADVIEALKSPHLEPFDQAIQGTDDRPGRRAVRAAIDRLTELNGLFARLASQLDAAPKKKVQQ